jgi:hypothetical protein
MSRLLIALALTAPAAYAADECMDSMTWHKNGDEAKDCKWVSMFAEKRCLVKGAVNKELASSACKKSCNMCSGPSLREQMCIPMFDAPMKPACVDAIEQAPADVTKGAVGLRDPTGVLKEDYEDVGMCISNVHWHLGAEHYHEGTYDIDGADWIAENGKGRRLAGDVRPGWFCQGYDETDPKMTTEYDWKYCTNMHVGYTYEVHWPHSSAAPCGLYSDGLAGLFCESHTPEHVGVQGQVFVVVNDDSGDYDMPRLIEGMHIDESSDIAKYTGSSTGQSHNNEICSPYAGISWHVDRACHMVSAKSFDEMCKVMKTVYGMKNDLYPHGSRELVDPEFVSSEPMTRA